MSSQEAILSQWSLTTRHSLILRRKITLLATILHRWCNFFYGFNCKIIYIEGHKNKVADALSCYYSSSSDKDLHYDDFISADIRIDKLGEDLPLSCAEEAWEMLFLNELHLVGVRIAAGSLNIKRDLQADQLNPPDDCIGSVTAGNGLCHMSCLSRLCDGF